MSTTPIRCRVSQREFLIEDEDRLALEKLAPTIAGQKFSLPLPTLSPDERRRQRLAFRNERNLYLRSCSVTGKQMVSVYSPDKPYLVYSKLAWWSDDWDARSYGRDMNFSRTFFEQFAELYSATPKMGIITSADSDETNCPYVNYAGHNKHSHMIFDSDFNEDSYYSNVLKRSRDCLDCSYVQYSELCFECIDCSTCYELQYSQNCENCSSSSFLYACVGCKDCCFCVNLVQQQYCYRNRKYSREEYYRLVEELELDRRRGATEAIANFHSFVQSFPKKFARTLNAENCTGDYITNAQNAWQCFNVGDVQDLRHCDAVYDASDCMDVSSFGEKMNHVYSSGSVGVNVSDSAFLIFAAVDCSALYYCETARTSRNCFGCSAIRAAEYCILNKQYTKEEYERLVPRIIAHMQETGEWGEYFPAVLSPFCYNESVAHEAYPLSKNEAVERGYRWSEYESTAPQVPALPATEVPQSIAEVADTLLDGAVSCAHSNRPFRITVQELEFLRRLGIPPPVLHPNVRHNARMSKRNPMRLWERTCAISGSKILTSFAPDRPDTVLSESAFRNAVHS